MLGLKLIYVGKRGPDGYYWGYYTGNNHIVAHCYSLEGRGEYIMYSNEFN